MMALLLNANDSVSRSYSITKPSPLHPQNVSGVGERTGNLFDRTGETVGYYLDSDGNLKKFSSNEWSVSDYISVSNSTQYTFTPNSMSGGAAYHVYYDSSKTFISSIASGAGTFTTPNNAAYMRFSYRSLSYDIMLNKGSTAQPYEPYGWCVPVTCGGTATNIYLGSATSTRRVKKLVLNSSQNWNLQSINSHGIANFYIYVANDFLNNTSVISNYFTRQTTTIADTTTEGMLVALGAVAATVYIRINSQTASTAQELKNWLDGLSEEVAIWYVLATPKTAATNEPLMKIGSYADEISKTGTGVDIPTVSGSNTLSVGTTVQPSEMSIESISQWV